MKEWPRTTSKPKIYWYTALSTRAKARHRQRTYVGNFNARVPVALATTHV
jgi:hypothetical protein